MLIEDTRMLFLDLWFISVILSACILYVMRPPDNFLNKLSVALIPLILIPFLSVLFVLLYPAYKNYKISKLLDLDDTITIYSAIPKGISKLDYVSGKITNMTSVTIRYRYNSVELDKLCDFREEEITGNLVDIFLYNKKKLTMRESELKVMIINSRLESLTQI